MSNSYDEKEASYLNNLLLAPTPVNQQGSQSVNPVSTYTPNPAFRPPHREPVRHNVYDVPDVEDVPPKPVSKKGKGGGCPAIPTTPLSLSQTTTPPDSKKQMRKTSRPSQAKNNKSFPNTTLSKASFSQNRSHSINGKPSNPYSKAPAAKEQFGIAMTTMEKLAAFRYQPSSTGSVHKAVAPSTNIPSYLELATEREPSSPSATVVPSGEAAQASGNKDYEPYQDPRAIRYPRIQAYDSNLDRSSRMVKTHYQGAESSMLTFQSQNVHATPNSAVANAEEAYSHVSESAPNTAYDGSHIMIDQPSEEIPSSVEIGRMRSQSFFACLLLNAAALSTAPSTANVAASNSEYDDGFEDADFRDVVAFYDPAPGSMPRSIVERPNSVSEPPQEAAQSLSLEHHYHQPPAGPDDDMLDYENFDDLPAESWDHIDYVVHANQDAIAANHSEHTEERLDHMDLDIAQDLQPMQAQNENQETAMDYADAVDIPVHSVEQIANAELITEDHHSSHGQTTVPGGDNQDYFAALEDFDDEDLKELTVPSSRKESQEVAISPHVDTVGEPMPQPEDEDYLAAFGEFDDEEFMDIEVFVPSGQKEVIEHQKEGSLHPMPVPQLLAIQYDPLVREKDHPQTSISTIPASLPEVSQNAHGDRVEDEYPLDEEEEAEMEHLRLSKQGVVFETNEPPSSIFHSEEDMRDMELYDKRLKYSPVVPDRPNTSALAKKLEEYQTELDEPLTDPEDWEFLHGTRDPPSSDTSTTLAVYTNFANAQNSASAPDGAIVDDEDYRPLPPFARPPFPGKVPARSPVTGISSNLVLRTCFRIGEALSQASLSSRDNQDAVTELFARITFSARETYGKKQNFQFGDIFHNKPPFISGVLEKYASSELQQTESSELITVGKEKRDGEVGQMVRVLGRVKRVIKGRGYTMEIINIRKTDWEEVRFMKRILGA